MPKQKFENLCFKGYFGKEMFLCGVSYLFEIALTENGVFQQTYILNSLRVLVV